MMGSFREEDEEYQFFDAHTEIASARDCLQSSNYSYVSDNKELSSFQYKVWTKTPVSVHERRRKFLNAMGLNSVGTRENCGDKSNNLHKDEKNRVMQSSGAVLRTSSFEDQFSSSRTSFSSWSNDYLDMHEESGSIICRAEKEHNQSQLIQLFGLESLNPLAVPREFDRTLGSGSAVKQSMQRKAEVASIPVRKMDRVKSKWLSRLRSMTCIVDRQGVANNLRRTNSYPKRGARVQRVKVRLCRRRWKELSALFIGQDIQAHEGSILTMKFSLDGQYLATAGEDGIVRVWQVVEDIRSNEIDIPEIDPSCIYFTMNHLSELAPLIKEKEEMGKLRNLRKTADTACIIFPPRVFRILEEPLHQFRGHTGEILDLSWSKNNCLLSSSVDTTARLWQVGCQQCLKVFPHSNYVTCIQFNPVDDNYFISGSIDGKVRIWGITCGQVVDWIDIRDIITAVCYRPEGQGVVVGSMTGVCRFYDISDDHFQLEAHICLHSKKKALRKKITGFQFLPQEPSNLMVTCADSQVRIIHGTKVVGKFRGDRSSGNQLCASFTSDGKHIVSTSEDSNVYLWDCFDHGDLFLPQAKIIKSWERFSTNASVAIPWCGLKSRKSRNGFQFRFLDRTSSTALPFSLPACLSLGQEFILESFPKVSATWPEEQLFGSNPRSLASTMHKSQYKFLRSSCQSGSSCHAWDLVIVTAGRDGRIRSFHNYGLPVRL